MTPEQNPSLLVKMNPNGVVRVTFNRPEIGNAYTAEMLQRVDAALDEVVNNKQARAIVLTGSGKHFQAGADLNWLLEVSQEPEDVIRSVSELTTNVVKKLNELTLPTIALVNGACFGGGTGIISCCDTVIATSDAMFSISEVLVGQAPLPIVPQLNATIGHRNSRRYALTGERFTAQTAKEIGLIHEFVDADQLEARGEEVVNFYLRASPMAIARTKQALLDWEGAGRGAEYFDALSAGAAEQRVCADSHEGLRAFLDKRDPAWWRDAQK